MYKQKPKTEIHMPLFLPRLRGSLCIALLVVSTLLASGLVASPNVQAQNFTNPLTPTTTTNSDQPLTQLELLDSLAQDAQVGQLNERDLRDLILKLKNENLVLEREILNLTNRKIELTNSLQRLNELKQGQQSPDNSTPIIQNLDAEISSSETELATVNTDLAKKQSKEEANISTIEIAEKRLTSLTNSVQEDVSTLQAQIFDVFSNYSFYFGLILIYFALLQLLNILADRFLKTEIIREIAKFVITLLVIVATVMTLLVAFVGNLTYLLTGLGVLSAALVVALQDFVSSMFAFFWIKLRGMYRNHDVIDINTGSTGIVTGVVTNIGIFRTTLKELYGEGELNAERSSGRTVSVPNNVVLRAPVVNYTKDNRILWHIMSVTITFESDFELAKKLLETIAAKQFKYAVDHKDQLLDDAYNLEYVYAPKIFMTIAAIGPQFDIWFAARYGHFREVKEGISGEVLHAFRLHGVDLAYNTSRIIATPKKDGDTSTIAFNNPTLVDK